jgi:hypothetical protein
LPDIAVRSEVAGSTGSFVRLSEILGSPVWDRSLSVTLACLWDCLPENRLVPLNDRDQSRRGPLLVVPPDQFIEPHPLVSVPVVYFPSWVVASPEGRTNLLGYLESFPDAQGYDSYYREHGGPDAAPLFVSHVDGWGELVMNWMLPGRQPGGYAEQLNLLKARTWPYDGSLYFFPAIGGASRGIHPLMAWWAVLYVLSMLARYHPAEWAVHINVDRSRHAVPLESVLKQAIEIIPRLIAEAIGQVSRPAV